MTILLDIDNVLNELTDRWVDWLSYRHRMDVKPQDIQEWDLQKAFPQLTKEEIHEPIQRADFWSSVQPKEGAVEGVRELEKRHLVYLVTNSKYLTMQVKYEGFLERRFPFIRRDQIIVAAAKHLIRGDVLVDDNPDNLSSTKCYPILMHHFHNASFHGDVERVHGWAELLPAIRRVELMKKTLTG